MTIEVGERIPDVELRTMAADGPRKASTSSIFDGKRVVLFGVPGAFTPACSDSHLPGFILRSAEIAAKGVDTIACVAVNDVFVMDAWGKMRGVGDRVQMLSDGNGELAAALGLDIDLSRFGMGRRTKRYAAVVADGVVEALHVEPAGEVGVSSAESILGRL